MSKPSSRMCQLISSLPLGGNDGMKAFEQDAVRLGRHQRGRAAVAPQAERNQLLQLGGLPEMQRAQLDIDDQHARLGSDRTMWRDNFKALIAA